MNVISYNLKRHIELLKRAQELRNQGKLLLRENPDEDAELRQYDIIVEQHIFWQERYQVALWMENFLNRKIDGEKLCDYVFGLRRKLRNKHEKFHLELMSSSEKMNDFQPDERSKNLSGFFTGLYCECDDFSEDYQNEVFRKDIKNGFLNFQKVLNEE